MEKNNGKIAIAIVAMFVVALSIVGVTYAYFVAAVRGNDTTINVDVTGGYLEVAFANDEGNTVLAKNVVPGWMSDGLHYYNPAVYTTGEDGSRFTAQMAADEASIPEGIDENDGITKPYNFTVKGTNKNTGDADYVIILNSISKLNVAEADKANFKYALCKDACPVWSNADDDDADTDVEVFDATAFDKLVANDAVIDSGSLFQNTDAQNDNDATEKTVIVMSGVETYEKTATEANKYQLMLYYVETGAAQASKGATISADIEIIGVSTNADGDVVDANGTIIIPKA